MRFTKMHGLGNDFVMVDGVGQDFPPERAKALAARLCDRRFGIGSDGLIVAYRNGHGLEMRMWNPDGSESEMCGNGVRCFAAFAREHGLAGEGPLPVQTGAGPLVLEPQPDGRVRVDMGLARLTKGEIGMSGPPGDRFVNEPVSALGQEFRGTAVSMGNPHLVVFLEEPETVDLPVLGAAFERHAWFPSRVNVHFARVESRSRLRQRTWERGAGATLACGTGACATAVAAVENGLTDRKVTVSLPGGELEIAYQEDGRVFMTGPATKVFEGEIGIADTSGRP